jgi:hypothetical protein
MGDCWMITPFNTEAFYLLYPQTFKTVHDIAYDVDGNEIEYDLDAVEAKAVELQAQTQAKQNESLNKLAALGLTPEDLQRILG